MKLIDHDGKILDKKEIEALKLTEEGKAKVRELILQAKTAYATHQLLGYLKNELKIMNRDMTYMEREDSCNVIWYSLFKCSEAELDMYIEECAKHLEDHGLQFPAVIGNA